MKKQEKKIVSKLHLIEGKITIPEKYCLSGNKKRLVVTMPYVKEIRILTKDRCHPETITAYFRHKPKDKPFIPEGFIEFDGDRYEVK